MIKHSKNRAVRTWRLSKKVVYSNQNINFMKYKLQALSKVEKLEHQVRALEIALNRGSSVQDVNVILEKIKDLTQGLRDTISIENDEWN